MLTTLSLDILSAFPNQKAPPILAVILLQHAIITWKIGRIKSNNTTKSNKALNNPDIQDGTHSNQPMNHSSGAPPSLTIFFCRSCSVQMPSAKVPLSICTHSPFMAIIINFNSSSSSKSCAGGAHRGACIPHLGLARQSPLPPPPAHPSGGHRNDCHHAAYTTCVIWIVCVPVGLLSKLQCHSIPQFFFVQCRWSIGHWMAHGNSFY